jgi:RNA polymerase sigma-70 factor, ECF subfamily
MPRPVPAGPKPADSEVYWSPRNKVDLYSFDAEYLRRLKAREPNTEGHFVSYFTPRLHVKLRQRGFSLQLLEEIRQETFFRVLAAVQNDSILYPERFGAFVVSVCDRVILENYRDITRSQHLDVENMDLPDRQASLESVVLLKEKRQIVAQILDQLSPRSRNVLRALLYEQLTRDELCARFGVTSDYLRVLLFRAREEFAALLKAKGLAGLEESHQEEGSGRKDD